MTMSRRPLISVKSMGIDTSPLPELATYEAMMRVARP